MKKTKHIGRKLLAAVLSFYMALALLPTPVKAADENIPADAVFFDGHRYLVIDKSMTWLEAKAYCESLGGHLVTITSAEEQEFVEKLARPHSKKIFWAGGSDARKEGVWEWVTGETWNYQNWSANTPDNKSGPDGGVQNYLILVATQSYRWDDIGNEADSTGLTLQVSGFICEWDSANLLDDVVTFNHHRYLVIDESMTWMEAKAYCENLGGHLAVITSANEQNFVASLAQSHFKKFYWLGGSDAQQEGVWRWVNGEVWNYQNWSANKPDNKSGPDGGVQNYLILVATQSYRWDDMGNEADSTELTIQASGFICEWDDPNPTAFTADKDGWPLVNAHKSFGYPADYHISSDRYKEVYGSVFSKPIQQLIKWNGNCFGLSLLSVAQYNGQIDMKDLFPARTADGLYGFGYNTIKTVTNDTGTRSGDIFCIEWNQPATELIERAHISQASSELKKAEVFSWDSRYAKLLDYLGGDDVKPLMVTLSFESSSHTMVITNDVKPHELSQSPGWYYIPLYDCSNPPSSSALNPPYWNTTTAPYLLVDTNSGDWQYCVNGSLNQSGAYNLLQQRNFRLYDVSLLSNDFFTEKLTGPQTSQQIRFTGDSFQICDAAGNILFKAANGDVVEIGKNCEYTPAPDIDGSGVMSGTLEIPEGQISCVLQNGELVVWAKESLVGAVASGTSALTIDAKNCKVEEQSTQAGSLNIVLQEKTDENYGAISLSGQGERGASISLAVSNGTVTASGTAKGQFNTQTETADGSQQHGQLTLGEINGLNFRSSDGTSSKTSFGSNVSDWAKPEVDKAYDMDLIPDRLIGEDLTRSITRLEFAAVAVKTYEALAGTKAIPIVNNPFTDCDDVEVLKAYGIGAINGTSAATFSPDLLLNREQAAAMLTRVFKRITLAGWTRETDSSYTLPYTMPVRFADDAQISDWARDSVYFMAANGIINGGSGNKFMPKNTTTEQEALGYANATREQALAIAVRMVEHWKK